MAMTTGDDGGLVPPAVVEACLTAWTDAPIVSTIPERCKRCYTCVRECPAKAIRVEGGQAMVLQERCITCGNCLKVCAQQAKRIIDCVPRVTELLDGGKPVFACLAPSFPAAFYPLGPGKLISAIRKAGFSEVWEVALGAELIGKEYSKLIHDFQEKGPPVISTSCPAVVGYVEKHMPSLLGALAPIVSPMIAVGRAIRRRHGEDVKIVFIGPCAAKKSEYRGPAVAGAVDAALTFAELQRIFELRGVVPAEVGESFFDSPPCHLARSFSISGGLLRTARLHADLLDNDIIVTEGKSRVLAALREVDTGQSQARFFDILFCEGCISGPIMPNTLSGFRRKEIIADFVNEQSRKTSEREVADALAEFADLDLSRTFTSHRLKLRDPTEEEIQEALRRMKKGLPEDRLDCGACGYQTCLEKAIAVCQDLAEPQMCLPYLIDELDETCRQLRFSHEELERAQRRLLNTERLASMGQLSAGVAHEINNPLGVVLIYSHMLLKDLPPDDPRREDLRVIVRESSRCRDIVRGLLDFARQSRVNKSPTDVKGLVQEVAAIMEPRITGTPVKLVTEVDPGLPVMMLDGTQIKQMIVNLVQNGMDAITGEGEVRIRARFVERGSLLEIRVSDTGCGIPEENLPKLFTPFFTTKEQAKGTGLGLAIAYGVVKMHYGDIAAESRVGQGTTFTITLPVQQSDSEGGPTPA